MTQLAPTAEVVAKSGPAAVKAGGGRLIRITDQVLSSVENGVILASYATLILIVGVETLRRAITGQQEVWGPEVALYAFLWLSWFSMAKHGRYGTHLAFNELRLRLPQGGQRALELLDCGFWLAVGAIIIVTSWSVVKNQLGVGQTVFGTSIPLAAASLAVPVGWAFSMLRIVQRALLIAFDWEHLKAERGTGFLTL